MAPGRTPVRIHTYIATLAVALAASVALVLSQNDLSDGRRWFSWVALVALYAVSEYVVLLFHHQGGRIGLSTAEAIFLPLVVGFTLSQTVLGVIVGAAVFCLLARLALIKAVFNIAEFGLAAIAASVVWHVLQDPAAAFSVRDAAAGVAAVSVFSLLTHVFTSGVIAIAEGRGFMGLLAEQARPALLNLAGSVALGLLFGTSLVTIPWTVALFPLPLAALFVGYRAAVRQEQEKERLEHLYVASRALASAPDIHSALKGFLNATREVVSAEGAVVVVSIRGQWFMSATQAGFPDVDLQQIPDERRGVIAEMAKLRGPVVAQDAGEFELRDLIETEVRDLVAVPLLDDDEFAGALLAHGRVGADAFSMRDARVLEALANELVLTLDSYRLFEEVREERERFERIFSGSKEGIALLDQDGVIKAWNPALARITGYSEEDILGERWSERVLIRDREHQRIDGMGIVHVSPDEELEVVTRQGPARWVSLLSGQVQSGDETQWVVIVRDITAEHELEEAKSDFLSTISHELRTPLTTIKGSLQMLGRPNLNLQSDVGKQMVEIMRRGSDRLERLVMNLLAVSQMETGSLQIFPDEVPLVKLVNSRLDPVLADHPFVEVLGEDEVTVRADRERLVQVVDHLLENARKFGGEQGKITIDVAKENGFAVLSVHDEGPGVPKADQDRIFDRFVRLGHVLTRETQGAGVGLFIAKRAVEAMEGEIWVDSDGREGSTFYVRIPLARPMVVADAGTPA